MFKTSLLINELTCRIGNAILLVVICWLSALRARVIPLEVRGCVSALPRARARTHYFAQRTLGSNAAVELSGSLIWWDSP